MEAIMTLDELADTLPNGFHDSEVQAITLDYSKHEMRMLVSVWVGDPRAKDVQAREAYRRGELVLSGMAFCVMESPDTSYPYLDTKGITIDTGELDKKTGKQPTTALPPISEGMFLNWIYVGEWNSFIYVAARAAQLTWKGEQGFAETIIKEKWLKT